MKRGYKAGMESIAKSTRKAIREHNKRSKEIAKMDLLNLKSNKVKITLFPNAKLIRDEELGIMKLRCD